MPQQRRERRVPGEMVDFALAGRPAGLAGCAPENGRPSFDEFVERHQAGLVRYAALLSGSAAQGEDLVQEVLIRVYLRWDTLSARPGDLLAYVRRAVTNEHTSWRRRWSTRHIRTTDDGEVPDMAVHVIAEPRDEVLWQRLLRLPPQQRAALVLRYYEDMADGDIAEVLSCRPATVRAHVSRGLARLRRGPADDGDPDEEDGDDAA
jgi:RNA polymerase sigma-70 factor (sigma-E family)